MMRGLKRVMQWLVRCFSQQLSYLTSILQMILTVVFVPADLVAYLIFKEISEQTDSKGTANVNNIVKLD
jgi:hypothetical protein